MAALTEALLGAEGNIEDSHMSILRGHFAVMLIVSVPERVTREQLRERVGPVGERLGLEALSVEEVDEVASARPRASHVITVYGADHPGIVHAVSAALAERGVNITDLETRLAGEGADAIYLMLLEVELGPAGEGEVAADLERVGGESRVEVNIRPLGTESL